jgi:type II secretory pathway pseudopilin PulG
MTRTFASQRGLSLAEVTIMLSVLSVLGAVLAPSIGDYVDDARRVRAVSDVQTLAATFARFTFDVTADRANPKNWTSADLLVGPGDPPLDGDGSDPAWSAGIDGARVGRLEDHLLTNTPGYTARQAGSPHAPSGWRGAYVSGLGPDPWGHRYAINVHSSRSATADTIAISPGPNGRIETAFDADGSTPSGDDIVAVIAGGR